MPNFTYQAIDSAGKRSSGCMHADSELIVDQRLGSQGFWVIEVAETKVKPRKIDAKVTRKDLVDFFSGLSTLLAAGISVADALGVIEQETERDEFRAVLANLKLNIESGTSFGDAMAAHTGVFEVEIRNLIKAGEYSGNLVEACNDISNHLEWVDQLVGDVKQATMYPSMIAAAVFALVMLMFMFVVPQFSVIFDSLDMELPAITKVVVFLGSVASTYWWAILLSIAGLVGILKVGPDVVPGFGMFLDRAKLALPVFGNLNQMLLLSKFTHNMALMLKAGVPIVDSLQLMSGVVGNRVMAKAVVDAEMAVTEGRLMSEAFADHAIISPIVMRMIVVGEETGKLDHCLEQVSVRMDNEIPRKIKRVFGVMEPLIILILLAIVGMVAAAIFMPMFSLMTGLGH